MELFFCNVEGGPSDGLVAPFFNGAALRDTGGCDAFGGLDLGALLVPARLCERGAPSDLMAPDARLCVCRVGGVEVTPFEPEEAVGARSEAGSCTGLVGDLGLGLLDPLCGGDGGFLVLAAGRLADLGLLEALAPPEGASEVLLVFLAGFFSGVLAGIAGFLSGVLLFKLLPSPRLPVGVVGVFGAGLEDFEGDVVLGDGLGAADDNLVVDIGAGRVADLVLVALSEFFAVVVTFGALFVGDARAELFVFEVGLLLVPTVGLLASGVFDSSSDFFGFSLISAGFANSLPRSGIGPFTGSGSPSCLLTSKAGVSARADSGMSSSTIMLAFLASNSCEIDSFLSAVSLG